MASPAATFALPLCQPPRAGAMEAGRLLSFGLPRSPSSSSSSYSSPSLRLPPLSASFKITIITPEDKQIVVDAPDDAYILDSLETAGLDVPYSCRAGACSTCVAKIVKGTADQSEGSFLDEEQMEKGFLLTCIAYPTSDLVIRTHAEGDL